MPESGNPREPVTLIDLLLALERSADLRPLARDCGLSVRELRRRLRTWSQEVSQEMQREVEGRDRAAGPAEGELFSSAGPPPSAPSSAASPATPPVQDDRPAEDGAAPRRARAGRSEWPELTAAEELEESPLPAEGEQVLEAWTDGGSRGNPGPAAIGIVFRQKDGPALATHAEAIGRATNNEAEYRAVIRALELCHRWRIERLDLFVDSELVARQLRGLYRVKSPSLRPLYQQAAHLARGLRQFRVRHVPREQNRHADHLAGTILSRG